MSFVCTQSKDAYSARYTAPPISYNQSLKPATSILPVRAEERVHRQSDGMYKPSAVSSVGELAAPAASASCVCHLDRSHDHQPEQ